MIQIVTIVNRSDFADELQEMYRDRKRVFVDLHGWHTPVIAGQFEIDRYDGDDAVYLLELHPLSRKHMASVRLLPTMKPNLLGETFQSLCERNPPRADNTWELTRFCLSPDVDRKHARIHANHLWSCARNFAHANNIAHFSCVTPVSMLSLILSAGWDAVPLGLPQVFHGTLLGAFMLHFETKRIDIARNTKNQHKVAVARDL